MTACAHGGFCVRPAGHQGTHNSCPSVNVREFDRTHYELDDYIDEGLTLLWLSLAVPAPRWADLLDDEDEQPCA